LRVAFVTDFGFARSEPEPAARAEALAHRLVELAGLELVELAVDLPKPGNSWGILSTIDDMAFHADDVKDRLDELSVVGRLQYESFAHLRPDVLGKAIRRRHDLLTALAAVFGEIDLLLTPTTPKPALAAEGELTGEVNGKEVTLFGMSAPFVAPFNLSGQPAASIPAGLVDGLPVGLQVVARRHEDLACLATGAVLEAACPWPKLAPYAYEG
jgi:aspartyl-tRNA(Asn)/glutamyl-tRNA(Gln) amidotransferase subunit A